MPRHITADAKGVYVIAATPFRDDGAIDLDGIDSMVDFYARCGVDGMTILGVLGAYRKLSETETSEVAARFLKRVDGRIPVIVGVFAAIVPSGSL
jgi:4-hydroxy-tetrahydrodipicolinate synthase